MYVHVIGTWSGLFLPIVTQSWLKVWLCVPKMCATGAYRWQRTLTHLPMRRDALKELPLNGWTRWVLRSARRMEGAETRRDNTLVKPQAPPLSKVRTGAEKNNGNARWSSSDKWKLELSQTVSLKFAGINLTRSTTSISGVTRRLCCDMIGPLCAGEAWPARGCAIRVGAPSLRQCFACVGEVSGEAFHPAWRADLLLTSTINARYLASLI